MKQNFFERNKKKSALAAFLLFLKGRGKYIAILLLALFASAPLVVTSDAFKAFTNHPAVAAVIRSLGLGGYQFNDTDMVAQAAHNREGKKSSYWKNYFKKINAPLPTGKFSTLKYLNGDISDLGPVKVNDKTKNKYGMKGVVNEANNNENPNVSEGADSVDLSQLMSGALSGAGADGDYEDYTGADSSSMEMELGINSAFGPYLGQKTILAKGGALNKSDSLNQKVESDFSSRIPRANGTIKQGKSTGRVSAFAWNRKARGQRAGAYNGARSGRSMNSKMVAAFSYSKNAMETENIAIADALAGAVFDGNPVDGAVLPTGEPIATPSSGAYVDYLNSSTGAIERTTNCANEMNSANNDVQPLLQENSVLYTRRFDDKGNPMNPPSCCKKGKVNAWNNDIDKLYTNCISIHARFKVANVKGCESSYPSMEQCDNYRKARINPCSKWKCFFMIILAILTLGLLFVLLGGGLIAIIGIVIAAAVPSVRNWLKQNVGGMLNKIAGTDSSPEGVEDYTGDMGKK